MPDATHAPRRNPFLSYPGASALPEKATGSCVGHDPETWFPRDAETYETAVAICAGCPLREGCREDGVEAGGHGVWGGVLFREGRPLDRFPVAGRPRKNAA